jgi:diguanylate cyclase (GGDEF)-like protein/PAS domain S-box-containing protein
VEEKVGDMFRVLTCLEGEHDWRLVVLAGAVCFLASLTAISLLLRTRATLGNTRALWLVTAGVASGCGIWATHFIAMLAYQPAVPIGFDIGLTALSLVVAIVIAGAGVAVAVLVPAGWAAPSGGAILGGGVASMHYLGMWALQVPGRVTWALDLVAASIVLGMLFGAAALVVAVRFNTFRAKLTAAVLLTLAIVSHHFTAMGAVEIVSDPTRIIDRFSLSPEALALAIANAALLILGLSLASAFSDSRLRHKDRQFAAAVNNMSQGVVMFDTAERLVVCNRRYVEMYGLSADVVKPGCTLRDLIRNRRETGSLDRDPEQYRAELLSAMAQGKTISWIVETPDGRAISVINRPIPGGDWVGTHEDITERKRAEARIAHMAHHDALTGLPNRAAFTERLSSTLEKAAADGDSFAILCVDLDRFKEVNDVFGHSVGDALLCEISRRLQAAAEGTFLARLGGDEFTLISEGPQPATAEALTERLFAALASDIDLGTHQVRAGLSVGVSIFPQDGEDAATLLINADAAMYRSKTEGRGAVRFFEPDMDKRLRDRRALQHDLRSAIAHGELSVHYQPQAVIGGAIAGFEALIRWHHPAHGMVPPAAFIPIAEESGIIIPIGEWILREACREAASWPHPLQVAINLSPIQFRHGDLAALVHAVLLETGLAPHRLELEITEGVLIGDFDRALSILRRLKALGVRIAMDDFGTGYSSLSYLQSFPFDKIKIDRSFIAKLDANNHSAAIIRAVIGLGRGLNLPVVAEGVETEAQLAFLSRESCDEIQGFLIGRPLPIAAYAEIVGRPPSIQEIAARPPLRQAG